MRGFLIAAALICVAAMAPGDTVLLRNGDRVSGNLLSIQDAVVRVETEYAGVIEIKQDAVAHIETDDPVALRTQAGATHEGALASDGADQVVQEGGGTEAIPVESITAAARDQEALLDIVEPTRWHGAVGGGAVVRTGNTDTTDFNLSASAERSGEKNTLTLLAAAAYGESDNVINTRCYMGLAKWRYYPRGRFFFYTLGSLEQDDGRKLDLRALASAGIGHDFIVNDVRKLSGELGLGYTYEEWAPFTPAEQDQAREDGRTDAWARIMTLLGGGGSGDPFQNFLALTEAIRDFRDPLRHAETREEDFVNLRLYLHYEQQVFRESKISEELTILPNLGDFGEFRATNNLSLVTPLSEVISLRLGLRTEYDSLATESDVDEWDNTFLASLHYKF